MGALRDAVLPELYTMETCGWDLELNLDPWTSVSYQGLRFETTKGPAEEGVGLEI